MPVIKLLTEKHNCAAKPVDPTAIKATMPKTDCEDGASLPQQTSCQVRPHFKCCQPRLLSSAACMAYARKAVA